MGSMRGWMQVGTKDKWLRRDPYQEWYDLWAVQESIDELASFFDHYLKGENNNWTSTPRVRMVSLAYYDKEPIYPIIEEDLPILRTDYRTLYLGAQNDRHSTPPTRSSIISYNSTSGTNPVSHAAFTIRFNKPTRTMRYRKSCRERW
jgi:hypothetical protein